MIVLTYYVQLYILSRWIRGSWDIKNATFFFGYKADGSSKKVEVLEYTYSVDTILLMILIQLKFN